MNGIGNIFNGVMKVIEETISNGEKTLKDGRFNNETLSNEQREQLEKGVEDAKKKHKELLKTIENANRNT